MILLVPIVVVFGLAAVTPLLTRWLGRNSGYLGAVVLAGLAGWLSTRAGTVLHGAPVSFSSEWLPSVGVTLALRMDSVGLLFAWIVLGIGALVLAYAARYFPIGSPKTGRYLSLLTFFAGSMLGLVLADDVLLLFVFWEFTSVSSFFLIGGLGEGKQGATRAFLTTAVGGLALLAGLLLLTVAAGTTSLSGMLSSPDAVLGSPLMPAAVVLLLLAVATKSAQLPFHFWLPGAMVAPTPVSTYLHAATMVKAGIYVLFRFTPLFAGEPIWQLPLVLVGLTTSVFAAVVALKATDLKALLAYSTVSQLGLLVGVIGLGTPAALAAAALHTLAHAAFKATLFMTVGIVDHETGTRDIRRLGGLRRTLPWTALAGGLAAASMAGLPPLLGFVSKESLFAAFADGAGPRWLGPLAVTLAVLASIGTFAYSARYYLRTFEGTVVTEAHRAPLSFTAPALLAAAAGLVLGLLVPVLDPLVHAVGLDTTGAAPEEHLALWHGLNLPLALSAVVVAAGLVLVARAVVVERWQGRVAGPSGAEVFDRLYAVTLAFGGRVGAPARSSRLSAHLAPVLATVLVVGALVALSVDTDLGGAPPASRWSDWFTVALLVAAVIGVVRSETRLGAISTLGLAGFSVAIWFAQLGAPDLALTQLLVETLTVALVVVVFRRLPSTFSRGSEIRKLSAMATATIVGIGAAGLTFLLTGRKGISEIGRTFLAEGEEVTGGANVVNTILVDFRALDTLGEISVLGVAAAAIVGLVRFSSYRPVPPPDQVREVDAAEHIGSWRGAGMIDSEVLRTANVLLAPLMVLASLWLLFRGHNAVGGGFIGGLTAGAAVVLLYFSRGHERIWQSWLLRTLPLAGAGLLVAVLYGLGGLAITGAFLAGGELHLPFGVHAGASVVFDIGVYLIVVGTVVAILRHLGQGVPEEPEVPRPEPAGAEHEPSQAEQRGPEHRREPEPAPRRAEIRP